MVPRTSSDLLDVLGPCAPRRGAAIDARLIGQFRFVPIFDKVYVSRPSLDGSRLLDRVRLRHVRDAIRSRSLSMSQKKSFAIRENWAMYLPTVTSRRTIAETVQTCRESPSVVRRQSIGKTFLYPRSSSLHHRAAGARTNILHGNISVPHSFTALDIICPRQSFTDPVEMFKPVVTDCQGCKRSRRDGEVEFRLRYDAKD